MITLSLSGPVLGQASFFFIFSLSILSCLLLVYWDHKVSFNMALVLRLCPVPQRFELLFEVRTLKTSLFCVSSDSEFTEKQRLEPAVVNQPKSSPCAMHLWCCCLWSFLCFLLGVSFLLWVSVSASQPLKHTQFSLHLTAAAQLSNLMNCRDWLILFFLSDTGVVPKCPKYDWFCVVEF